MSSQRYVGAPPSAPSDLTTRLAMSDQIAAATPNRISVASQAIDSATGKASKSYVDTQDATFVSPSYYQGRDALNVPLAALGAANGVASLDEDQLIPLEQFPAIGAGFISGPYGPTDTFAVAASSTPVKIAQWDLGVLSVPFQPVIFGDVMATANNFGRPVVEFRMSDGEAAYSFQTLIGQGFGRNNFNAEQPITIWPAPGTPGSNGTAHFSPSMHVWITAWLYDPTGNGTTVTAQSVVSAPLYLLRTTQ